MSWLIRIAAVLALCVGSAEAQVVISQVYGGGGNSGATYRNDFIELFNAGVSETDLSGYSVQYGSSTGDTWQQTNLSGTLKAGQYYLIQESQGTGGTVDLPTPDATGSLAMSATAGKVALVSTQALLTGTCPVENVLDLVGYGPATNCFKGVGPTAALSNTTAAIRNRNGCGSDFAIAAPAPRNTASPIQVCVTGLTFLTPSPLPSASVNVFYSQAFTADGGTPPYRNQVLSGTLPPGLTLTGNVLSGIPSSTTGSPFRFVLRATDATGATSDKSFQLEVQPASSCAITNTISQIQGSGDASPLVGATVTTTGIVTGRKTNGFFIQMPGNGDGDPATSDGVFVFTSSAPPATAIAGNLVCVTGPVQEFNPVTAPGSASLTEISRPSLIQVLASNQALPDAIPLSAADLAANAPYNQLERYEGMLVRVDALTVTAPTGGSINEATATATSNGVFYGVLPGTPRPFREPGIEQPDTLSPDAPCCIPRFDGNPETIAVDTRSQGGPALDVTTGAIVTGLIGPLDFQFRHYAIVTDPTASPRSTGNVTATPVPIPGPSDLTIASFNLQHFYDTSKNPNTTDVALNPAAFERRLSKASLAIRHVLQAPDILGVEELENLSTLRQLAAKISFDAVAAGEPDPRYEAYLEEGNDISGINVGFLVKADKVQVNAVTQLGKDATYLDPANNQPALLNDRPSLVLDATVASLPVTVIVNHLRSLNGVDDPAEGPRVRAKRRAQAEYLAALIRDLQAADPARSIVSIGDYNAYQVNDGYVDVIGTVKGIPTPADQVLLPSPDLIDPYLIDLVFVLPPEEQYSYTFDGDAQAIDHVLVNLNAMALVNSFVYARNNVDFPETYRNDPARPERVSDHDAPVVYLTLPLR